MKLRVVIVFASILAVGIFADCRSVDSRRVISYTLAKSDAKSAASIITRRRLSNVAKCKDFAENKQALAFTFERLPSEEANCILYRCPETSGLRHLANETGFDYFSAYSKNVYAANASLSCVEQVGLFRLYEERQNFTNARASCQKIRGVLADVSSDARTRGLAVLIGKLSVYVGLSNESKERIWKNEYGDALLCFDYRAWASGEPSHNRGCVALFQADRKSEPIWKVVPCSTELPYICELPRWQPSDNSSRSFLG